MQNFDLLIVGGGINGAAIARDAALRGASVLLVEKDDLGAHTSSASSKLIHGGLRYLEYFEFRLVREALKERAILLHTAPHIVSPLRFVLPHAAGMRPRWMIRAGLYLYDLLSLRGGLPRSRRVRADEAELATPLVAPGPLLSYWDAWVDDARLVVLNALDAAENGAEIATRTELLSARREREHWRAQLSGGREIQARAIVNAAGPWVAEVLGQRLRESSASKVRLIKGSHLVVPRLYDGEHAYILQQPDGRVVFALPYGEFSLVGTTDIPVDRPEDATVSGEEVGYLCEAVNLYFRRKTAPGQVVWSYAGVRSLYDDGVADAKAVTRDYHLELDKDPGAKLLSVFGGKITTARALAEEALDRLRIRGRSQTTDSYLPGGEMDEIPDDRAQGRLPAPLLSRLAQAYGGRISDVLSGATDMAGLGRHFGAGLYEVEVRYLREREFARTADDILWRRTKLGLRMNAAEREALARYLA